MDQGANMLEIEFPSTESYYSFTTPIEGSTYKVVMEWMNRTQCWYMTLYDSNNNVIVTNLKLVSNFPLLFQKVSIDFVGDFMVFPKTNETTITQDNLITSWQLIYLSEDDL